MPHWLEQLSAASLAGVVLLAFASLSAASSLLGFIAEWAFPTRRILGPPRFAGQLRFELVGNAIFLAIATATVTLALHSAAIRFGPSTPSRDVATFMALLVGFQVFYWFLHRAMHTRALVKIHRWHHRSQTTTPLTGQSMSPAEAALWMLGYVGLPIALSRISPIGFWGWAGYLAFNVSGNVFGHANVEMTIAPGATRTASLFANAFVFHALHHARWTGHYGFQGAAMDRLMGTEWSDWPELYRRITHGQPIKSYKERAGSSAPSSLTA